MSVAEEIKAALEEKGRAWEEYKRTIDEAMKAKAEGKAVSDLEAKADALGKAMDDATERVDALVDEIKSLKRPGNGGGEAEAEAEFKSFMLGLRADLQTKGRASPADFSIDAYRQYKSGFLALARHGDVERLSPEERKAMIAGSDPDGGYLLPAPTVGRMVQRIYERSAIRQLATVLTISTNDLEGIVDNDEADAGWVSELGTRNDTDTPQVGKYRIEAHEMYAQPKVSQRILDDAAYDIEAFLGNKVGDKFARVESVGFAVGDGVGKPRGLFAYPTAATSDGSRAWGTFEHVNTGASGDFHTTKADPLQDLIGAFKDQYLQNATWLMRREVRTKLRKMKIGTADDRYLWEPSLQAGQPDRLLGYPVRIDQFVPVLASGSLSLAFGDIREAYTIVDRLGVRTLRDPYTAKPYVRFYSTKRTGGGAVNFEAVKFLRFGT